MVAPPDGQRDPRHPPKPAEQKAPHEQFFAEHGKTRICAFLVWDEMPCTFEELYQHFKARMLEEMLPADQLAELLHVLNEISGAPNPADEKGKP